MKTAMITNEMKARIFAAYLGSKARRLYRNTGEDTGSHIESDLENINALCFGTGSYTYKLILTPLSEITDEDAIAIANLLKPGIKWSRVTRVNNSFSIHGDRNELTIWYDLSGIYFEDNDDTDYDTMIEDIGELLEVTDFLRSKGYALPYMGIDLFEAGIAIPKPKQ